MKPRVELSPTLLKHYRTRRDLSFKQAGECLRKRPAQSTESLANMYERVERTGITSPERARTIAKHLGVEVPALQGEQDLEGFGFDWWLESNAIGDPDLLLQGTMPLMWRLWEAIERHTAARLMLGAQSHVRVEMSRTECKLTYTHPDSPYDEPTWWSIRSARRSNAGITWQEFTKHEFDDISARIRATVEWSADVVHQNGRRVPAAGSELAYNLRFLSSGEELPIERRIKDNRYATSGQLCSALVRRLKRLATDRVYVDADRDGLTVSPTINVGNFFVMRLWRRNAESPWKRGPWSVHSVRQLGNELETKLKQAIPGVQFCDLDIEAKAFVPRRVRDVVPP